MQNPKPTPGKERNVPALSLTTEMISLLARINKLASIAPSLDLLEKSIVEAIAKELPYYNWTGFYMLDPQDPQTLVLGAFAGEPTPHVRIPVAQGICGAAVASSQTVVVDDVNADPRYLSCSIKTKSEIVVPISAYGEIVGEIDIDSHTPAAFTGIDRLFLEEAARIVGAWIEERSITCQRIP
jgi:GAF domain-containing protein